MLEAPLMFFDEGINIHKLCVCAYLDQMFTVDSTSKRDGPVIGMHDRSTA
jgi:hypothetical protein